MSGGFPSLLLVVACNHGFVCTWPVTSYSMGSIMVIYLLCALTGYVTFLQTTNGDLLLNYAITPTFVPQALMRAVGYCIGLSLLLSLPGTSVRWLRHCTTT